MDMADILVSILRTHSFFSSESVVLQVRVHPAISLRERWRVAHVHLLEEQVKYFESTCV